MKRSAITLIGLCLSVDWTYAEAIHKDKELVISENTLNPTHHDHFHGEIDKTDVYTIPKVTEQEDEKLLEKTHHSKEHHSAPSIPPSKSE